MPGCDRADSGCQMSDTSLREATALTISSASISPLTVLVTTIVNGLTVKLSIVRTIEQSAIRRAFRPRLRTAWGPFVARVLVVGTATAAAARLSKSSVGLFSDGRRRRCGSTAAHGLGARAIRGRSLPGAGCRRKQI